jgi:hypothetical protein
MAEHGPCERRLYLQLHVCSLRCGSQLPLLLARQPCYLLGCLQQQVADVLLRWALLGKAAGSQAQAPAEGTLQLL